SDPAGIQPLVVAERPFKSDESVPRARGRTGHPDVQHRGVSTPAGRVQPGPHRARAVSRAFAAPRRVGGGRLQRPLRRDVQPVAASAGAAFRLASHGVLHEMTASPLRFKKAHAFGNDFIYVRRSDAGRLALQALAQELCERHTGVGADGLIVYEPTADGAEME